MTESALSYAYIPYILKGFEVKTRYRFFLLWVNVVVLLFVIAPLSAQDAVYTDATQPVEARVEDLLAQMTLEEKIGQMTLVEKGSITPDAVTTYFIGGVLSGGGGAPTQNTPQAWLQMVTDYQNGALATRLAIPMIYGVDAIHGHNNLYGATIFPHNVGLGATGNADLVEQIGRATATEIMATGIYWNYAPVIAVVRDIRWGRAYEAFGENTELATELGLAAMRGLQGDSLSVLATPKHYIGDGATTWGTSTFGPDNIDRGDTVMDEATLREVLLPPYIEAVNQGALSIMASYNSWNGLPLHAERYLMTDVLKGELGFEGFIVSDWQAIDQITPNFYEAVVTSINAGVDMNMVPYNYQQFITTMLEAVDNGDITMERIDDAVRRILRAKFAVGLFEHPTTNGTPFDVVGSDDHRALARQAVQESLVLLKNNDALPINPDAALIFVAGSAADDIGMQSGGWTIQWQGAAGNITEGTTILEGIDELVSADTLVEYSGSGRFDSITDANGTPLIADVGIVVVGEEPYAEFEGDSATLALSRRDLTTIERVRAQSAKLIVVLVSGRPMIITDQLNSADAVVAAWLPGSEGQGVADVLFGDAPFTGTLPYTWPRSVDQLPFDFANIPTEGCAAPLFPYGYGLTTEDNASTWVMLAAQCAGAPVAEAPVEEAPVLMVAEGMIAPEGTARETYYAPFPVSITLDGAFGDWAGIPEVVLLNPSEDAGVTFAAAADATMLYLRADILDDNLISGQHGADYWNEDSVEFYINGTGDFELSGYETGVVQITVPALNADAAPSDIVIAGVQGATAGAQVVAVRTETGYAVELAVPLQSDIWDITPAANGTLGFNVHLNGASTANRDTKLIWSAFDTSDQSYQNPSVFGELVFYALP